MKKTTRLTALLLALVLLLANLSASATEDGIRIEDTDLAVYNWLVDIAESDYDDEITALVNMVNAQARYEHLNFYVKNGASAQADAILTYYYANYAEAGILCTCMGDSFDAAYAPGAGVHTEGCPWHADNLILYYECSNADGVACGYNHFVSDMNGFERHEYLKKYIGKTVDNIAYENGTVAPLWYELFANHLNYDHWVSGEMPYHCTCYDTENGKVLYDADHYDELAYGSVNHGKDMYNPGGYCAWHFSQISVDDQYEIIKNLTEEEQAPYWDSLSVLGDKEAAARAALEAKFEKPEIPENPEITAPEWDGKSEEVTLSFTIPGASSYVWEQGLFSYFIGSDINDSYSSVSWTVIEGQNGPTLTMDAAVDTLKYLYRCTAKTEEGTTIATSVERELIKSEIREWAAYGGEFVTDEMFNRAVKAGGVEVMVLEGNELIYVKAGGPIATYNPETHELIDSYLGVAVAKYDPETGKMTSLYNAE